MDGGNFFFCSPLCRILDCRLYLYCSGEEKQQQRVSGLAMCSVFIAQTHSTLVKFKRKNSPTTNICAVAVAVEKDGVSAVTSHV